MEPQMKVNGNLVRALREEKSWSQEHLASASGLSVRTVQRVEAECVASSETRLALAAALGIPVAALVVTSPGAIDDVFRLWRVPLWVWIIWGIAAGCSVVLARDLIPLLALVGACLGVATLAGGWISSRSRRAA